MARPVVGRQPGLMNDHRPSTARGVEHQLQRRGEVLGLHGLPESSKYPLSSPPRGAQIECDPITRLFRELMFEADKQ